MSTAWTIGFAVLAVFVFFLGLLELGTLRRVADLLERAEIALRTRQLPSSGLEPGSPVPFFAGELAAGGSITSEELAGGTYVMVFVSATCHACDTLLRDLTSVAGFEARVLVVVNDFGEAPGVDEAGRVAVIRQFQGSIAQAFRTSATPHAFVVDAQGRVAASGITNSLADLRRLVEVAPTGDSRAKREAALLGFDGKQEHA